MKKLRWTLLALAFSIQCHAASESPELTVYYFERLPFFGTQNGQPAGLLIDISKRIFDIAGIHYTFVQMPVRRLFDQLKDPRNACTVGALKTSDRASVYTYSDDFIYQDMPFMAIINANRRRVISEEPTVREILQSTLRLGVIEGYAYGEWLDTNLLKYAPNAQKINIGDDTTKMHRMITNGRFDYMFAVAEEAHYVIDNHPEYAPMLTTVKIADAPTGNKRYLLCSKGIDDVLMQRINSAIAQLKTGGEQKQPRKQP